MELPSKELLSQVLDKNVQNVITDIEKIHTYLNSSVKNSEIAILYDDKWTYENIYELMHLMKEWAVNKGFVVLSRNDSIGYRWTVILSMPSNLNFNKTFEQLSEFEAVTKACEWILSQKESK